MNERLKKYLIMQINLGKLTLKEVQEKYPEFKEE